MRLSIRHEIDLVYQPAAKSALGVLRLDPRRCDTQQTLDWSVDLDQDCGFRALEDAYGAPTRAFYAEGPLERLTIVASGVIDTYDCAGVVRSAAERFPPDFYLRDTALTQADAALRQFAQEAAHDARTTLDKPHLLMGALHARWRVDSDERADAAAAFAAGGGRPRDLAHVMTAAARALGLPARMVSGYLCVAPQDAKWADPTDLHYWAEIFVDEIGWIGFDPALCLCAFDAHAALAFGLDHLDVAPVRAASYGGAEVARESRLTILDGAGAPVVTSDRASDDRRKTDRQSQGQDARDA